MAGWKLQENYFSKFDMGSFLCYIINEMKRGCSSMVERKPSKLTVWVRFPSPAHFYHLSKGQMT